MWKKAARGSGELAFNRSIATERMPYDLNRAEPAVFVFLNRLLREAWPVTEIADSRRNAALLHLAGEFGQPR